MKRRDLERRLRIAGCYLKREGGSHSLWMNRGTETVPRHSEIKEPLARMNASSGFKPNTRNGRLQGLSPRTSTSR